MKKLKTQKPHLERPPLLIVALTGGIAAGKSLVALSLKARGCYIHSADKVAYRLMRPGNFIWEQIVSRFGSDILDRDQTISRSRLGVIIFSDEKERRFLNNLIHPRVLEKKREIIQRLRKKGTHKIFVSEAALTIESGFASFFDKIIVVTCREEIQEERLMKRDGISKEEARKKIASQMPPAEKLRHADYIIDSSGTKESTIRQTENVYGLLLADYKRKLALLSSCKKED